MYKKNELYVKIDRSCPLRLQWHFREFRNSDTDIENNSQWREFFSFFHAQTATIHTKESGKCEKSTIGPL